MGNGSEVPDCVPSSPASASSGAFTDSSSTCLWAVQNA